MTLHASRRDFLQAGSFAAAALMSGSQLRAEDAARPPAPKGKGRALHLRLARRRQPARSTPGIPKRRGDPKAKKPGSYYDAIDTAIPGVQVCEHLPRCAKLLDRFNLGPHGASRRDRRARRRRQPHAHRPADERHGRLSVDRLDHRPPARAGRRRRAGLRADRLSRRHPRPGLPRREARLRLSDRHRTRPRRACRGRPIITADRQARREALLAQGPRGLPAPALRRSRCVKNYDATIAEALRTGRARVHAHLPARPKSRPSLRNATAASSASAACSPAGWSRRACGSSRSRTT